MNKKDGRAKRPGRVESNSQFARFQVEKILESVSDSIVALDTEWRYTYVNEKAAQTFGRKPEQLIGKHIWTEFPEGVGQPFYKAYYKAVETQQPVFLEEYYPPYDRWFENRIYPSRDGLSIFFHDITDRKKAELALQEQERFTSAITNTIPALIYVYDMETQSNVYSNAGIEQLLGFSTKDIQAMGADLFIRLIHPDDIQNVFDLQSKIMAAKDVEIFEIEYRMKDRDGGWHTLRSYERPFARNADGSLKQKLGAAIDITERKRAQEELQRNEQVLRLFVENSPASIAMFDRNMKYIIASRRYLVDYDLGNQDVTGRSHYEIFPEMPERWKEIHRRCLGGATERAEEDPFPRANGEVDWVRWEIRPWHERNGEIGGVILFSEVITERKQAEKELRIHRDRLADLSKKLVEVHEAESRAIGRELHDQIGQMLTALKLTLEIESQLPPELREKKNKQMQELVNDLLKRVSALSLELRPPMLDDLGLIPALLWHINRFEEQTGIAVDFKHSGAEDRRFSAEVETTAYRVIQEAFTNIARHARAGHTRLEVHAGSGRMKIQIEDDGAGFDPQAVFEKHRGLGGMRERIGLLSGTFRIESQKGKGTSLFIELPLKENA